MEEVFFNMPLLREIAQLEESLQGGRHAQVFGPCSGHGGLLAARDDFDFLPHIDGQRGAAEAKSPRI